MNSSSSVPIRGFSFFRFWPKCLDPRPEAALDPYAIRLAGPTHVRNPTENVPRPARLLPPSLTVFPRPFLWFGFNLSGLSQPSHEARVFGRRETLVENLS
jgi:hypothetical protein